MATIVERDKSKRLSAFIGRSFLDEDIQVWHDLRDILDSFKPMGFNFEDGKEGQVRAVSKKVQERISRNDIYIGVLTKRYPVWQPPTIFIEKWRLLLNSYVPKAWTTSEWIIEEIGFAIGKGHKVILLIEEGVNFPISGLDGDTQWIPFNREHLSKSQSVLSEMVLNLFSERVISKTEPASVITTDTSNQDQDISPQKPSFGEQMAAICTHVQSGNLIKADEIQDEIIRNEPDSEQAGFAKSYILGERAINGDHKALDYLKRKSEEVPIDFSVIIVLANVFDNFRESNEAAKLLISHLDSVPTSERSKLVLKAAKMLCKNKEGNTAISLLIQHLQIEEEKSKYVSLYIGIAQAAKEANIPELEMAFLEMVLMETPADSHIRFRLALVYFNNELYKLSAYHNELVVANTNWPAASNNLGVDYGELGFKGNQCRLFETVVDEEPLAKANIAVIRADAGLYTEARALANAVLTPTENDDSNNETAIDRAHYALEQITKLEKTEKEAIAQIADNTKTKREFMCSYAKAYCAPSLKDEKGVYSATHREIEIARTQNSLKGAGILTKKVGLGIADAIFPNISGNAKDPKRVKSYSLTLSAKLHGQAGTYELEIVNLSAPNTALGKVPETVKGLLYFQDNGNVIQLLKYNEKEWVVESALIKH